MRFWWREFTTPALYKARLAWSYASLEVLLISKTYFLPRLMFSFRKKAKWPFRSRLYCIMTALVTVSHLWTELQHTSVLTGQSVPTSRTLNAAMNREAHVRRHLTFLSACMKINPSSLACVKHLNDATSMLLKCLLRKDLWLGSGEHRGHLHLHGQ